MTKIKNPFDYLTEDDLARIDEWLAHPKPTVDDAVEILGLDKNKFLEFIKEKGIELPVDSNPIAKFQKKRITLKYADSSNLIEVTNFIIKNMPEFTKSPGEFSLIQRSEQRNIFGAGDHDIVAIELVCDLNDTDISEKIKLIQSYASNDKKELLIIEEDN